MLGRTGVEVSYPVLITIILAKCLVPDFSFLVYRTEIYQCDYNS